MFLDFLVYLLYVAVLYVFLGERFQGLKNVSKFPFNFSMKVIKTVLTTLAQT